MKVALFNVDKNICENCTLALRRFIGGMDGVESIEAMQGKIAVKFNETAIDEETVARITRDSIEKLGYRVEE
jgi:copper chaperone CopZ